MTNEELVAPAMAADGESALPLLSRDGRWRWDGRQRRAVGSTSSSVTLGERIVRFFNGPQRRWYSPRRLVYSFVWTFYTTLLSLGGLGALLVALSGAPHPATPFTFAVLLLAGASATGCYVYRIWTWRATELYLLIIV